MKRRKPWLRRMGFLTDQDGIMNRYLRESAGWDPHLHQSREFILQCFQDKNIQSVAVLGSGWLLDVPVAELAERFRTVYLADIRHPPQIRKRVEGMDHVQLIETDLTGGAVEQIWKRSRRLGTTRPDEIIRDLEFSPPLEHFRPDALISVNLLNQLDILLVDYLEKQRHFQQQSLAGLRAWLQKAHLDWISGSPGCLITDTVEVNRDKTGKEIRKSLIYCDLPEGTRSAGWKWDFDSRGTYRPGSLTHMEVTAIEWA